MSILSANQRKILEIISKDKLVCDNFYLTGGTALAEFYLQHRLSEDLDLFSENEFESQGILIFLEKMIKFAKRYSNHSGAHSGFGGRGGCKPIGGKASQGGNYIHRR